MRSKNDQYFRLSSHDHSQDITDLTDRNQNTGESHHGPDLEMVSIHSASSSRSSSSSPPQRKNTWRSVQSTNSLATNTSKNSISTGFEKLKNGWDRGFRKGKHKTLPSLPRYAQGSIHQHPAAEVEPTKIGRGIWKDQLLVDRSLRTMALTMCLFAFAIVILLIVNAKPYSERLNKSTSSVGGVTQSCKAVKNENAALLLLINIAGTMILGMSNTYQQLITSLTVQDIKPALEKLGDSRVGTNSPFNINHKTFGRKRSWVAWTLLVATSLPIHFLANSLMGPSYVTMPPDHVEYNVTTQEGMDRIRSDLGYGSFLCWSSFRTGRAHFARPEMMMSQDMDQFQTSSRYFYRKIVVSYDSKNCEGLENSTTDIAGLQHYSFFHDMPTFMEGNCSSKANVKCNLEDPAPVACRLNVRMSAGLILAVALVIKATYMVTINIRARGHIKQQLLTFGDVIVASATHPELRIQGECMVNARESYRRHNRHTCHKHCKNPVASLTGDEIGHCQSRKKSCKKFNSTNKLANQPQPTIATKIKRGLISNLGNTALTQMVIMVFTGVILLGASLLSAVMIGSELDLVNKGCDSKGKDSPYSYYYDPIYCAESKVGRLGMLSGGWGGINTSKPLTTLGMNSYSAEIGSFGISNGAQFIYSLLYLMFIYNLTLISQEHDWGKLEHDRKRLRTTIVKGEGFTQDYLLQLPKKILIPTMISSILIHWLLGEALHTQEAIWLDKSPEWNVEHSQYVVSYATYPLWCATVCILAMTGVCRWAFTYRREGFIPQMFGSIRVLCSATTQLDDFPVSGIKWGDLGEGQKFRHAGLSGEEVMGIVPYEIYAGISEDEDEVPREKKEI
ncbi:unnamed protein product [Periconia digitata]|uniref:DUF6536 domain-containing protein n=1 Tax=Periconia digitata TaxID=1303443 RepID=A0A9W4USP2_9PLEO|nr:unnamed protein product [Periconia digitata]